MDLTESLVTLVGETAQALKGHARRVFMAPPHTPACRRPR